MLINTSRGGVMDEDALYDALKGGSIAGACLDVFTAEPYVPLEGKDLRTLSNILLAPHVASNTVEANDNMARSTLESIRLYEEGELSKIPLVPELRSLIG
ncbi:D-3-phosphoglycerate dehydrogenase [bioreactor metagenome]|uniref:D-3-phosphoglycerate dehydrogenase n=1 Tax=bioreactor metagenome TaxID=1076179 RepID=A0A645C4V5_9ZZZZ